MITIGRVDVYLRGAAIGRSIELFAPAQDRESSAQLFLPLDRPAPVRSRLQLVNPNDPSHKLDFFHVAHTIEVPTPSTSERRGCWGYLQSADERTRDEIEPSSATNHPRSSLDDDAPSISTNSSRFDATPSEKHELKPTKKSSEADGSSDHQPSSTSENNERGNSPRTSRRSKRGKRKNR